PEDVLQSGPPDPDGHARSGLATRPKRFVEGPRPWGAVGGAMSDRVEFRFRRDPDGVYRSYLVQTAGSLDGQGAADHDEPYHGFNRQAFTLWEYARLLVLRGQVQDARAWGGRFHDDLPPLDHPS
ncbi:MAG TPA: hypothetical protein VIN09_11175, partial [Chloroflexota bacterium]